MSTVSTLRVGLIGDRDLTVMAHRAIEQALPLAAAAIGLSVEYEWLATDSINAARMPSFNGFWCVPASPYRDTDAVLAAIRYAREQTIPFLGTCGGFQHALLEYAQNALGWNDAEHGELPSQGGRAVIAPRSCALGRYRLNPEFAAGLLDGALRATGWDEDGEVRVVELAGSGFFVATLFQPERVALDAQVPPLVLDWLKACSENQ